MRDVAAAVVFDLDGTLTDSRSGHLAIDAAGARAAERGRREPIFPFPP